MPHDPDTIAGEGFVKNKKELKLPMGSNLNVARIGPTFNL